jgi:phospholipid/cholesterol/gamma-HCH transport system substrate-binding protein
MKRDSNSKWKVGLFVLVGLALFLGGIFFIGNQKNLFSPVFHVQAVFSNVAGLKVGSNVRVGGITVGTVQSIALVTDTSVKVVMTIESNVRRFISKDAGVSIGNDGLMGEKVIVISPGMNGQEQIKEGGLLTAEPPVDMDQIFASLKLSVDHAAVITGELSDIAYRINHGNGILSRLIGDTIFASNIAKTMTNLKNSSKGLDENMEAAKHNFLLSGYFKKQKKEAEKKKEELDKAKLEQKPKS